MQIRVLLFAAARDRAGTGELSVEVADGARAAEVRAAVVARCPGLQPIAGQLRVAVNHAFVDDAGAVGPGDEVALLPPVSGGSGRVARLSAQPLSLDAVMRAVSDEEHGAVATFSGVVRRTSHGQRVHRLDYEAYGAMAERVLRTIIDEIEAAQPGVRLAIEHRVGELVVGDVAVVIAAGAPHRREALAACQTAIDAVKARAPIWKREHTAAGAEWVGCDGCARLTEPKETLRG